MSSADSIGEWMCYWVITKGNKPCYLIWLVLCILQKNIGTNKEHVNDDVKHVHGLENMELSLINSSKKHILKYHKYNSTPAQWKDSGETDYAGDAVGKDLDMDISDDDDLENYG